MIANELLIYIVRKEWNELWSMNHEIIFAMKSIDNILHCICDRDSIC
jgi:hypothetical protein